MICKGVTIVMQRTRGRNFILKLLEKTDKHLKKTLRLIVVVDVPSRNMLIIYIKMCSGRSKYHIIFIAGFSVLINNWCLFRISDCSIHFSNTTWCVSRNLIIEHFKAKILYPAIEILA